MTCTAASHQGAIKEPAALLSKTSETHPVPPKVKSYWSKILFLITTFSINLFYVFIFLNVAFHNRFYIYQRLNSANREITNFVVAPFLMYF